MSERPSYRLEPGDYRDLQKLQETALAYLEQGNDRMAQLFLCFVGIKMMRDK